MEKNMKSGLNFFYFAGIRSLPRQKTAQYFLTQAIQIQNPILTPQIDFGLTKPKERAILWLMAYVRIQERQVVKVARPRKCRRVCTMPAHNRFGPLAESSSKPPVVLSVDEYETIRLVDLEEYRRIEAARETVLEKARKIEALSRETAEGETEIRKLENEREALEPWKSLPVPMNFTGTKRTKALIGAFPEMMTSEQLGEKVERCLLPEQDRDGELPGYFAEVVSADSSQTVSYTHLTLPTTSRV